MLSEIRLKDRHLLRADDDITGRQPEKDRPHQPLVVASAADTSPKFQSEGLLGRHLLLVSGMRPFFHVVFRCCHLG